VPHVAVAIGRTGPNGEYVHAAILYRRADKRVQVLDFDLGGRIQSSNPTPCFARYAWAIPQWPDTILEKVARYCESVAAKTLRFTYQFSFDEGVLLAEEGESFVIQGGKEGFTCATFVLAIFQTLGFPLANLSTWISRPEDEKWRHFSLIPTSVQSGEQTCTRY
jgi:hypothetical protein